MKTKREDTIETITFEITSLRGSSIRVIVSSRFEGEISSLPLFCYHRFMVKQRRVISKMTSEVEWGSNYDESLMSTLKAYLFSTTLELFDDDSTGFRNPLLIEN